MWNLWKWHKLLLVTFTTLLVVVPLSISQPQKHPDHVLEIWGSTYFKISKIKYTWTIYNLNYCCNKVGDIIKSPTFSADGCNWYMDIRPKGENEEYKDYVALYVFSVNCNKTAVVKFSILNDNREQTFMKNFTYQFEPPNSGRGFGNFILQKDLINTENKFMSDNKLTIICEINAKIGMEKSTEKISQRKRELADDLGLLLDNELFSDVTLIADGKEFKAHKSVLAARSSVFKTRFEKEIKKGDDILVEITDVDPKTLREMLRYIYTEETPNLEKVTANLLDAAENYQLDKLKTICENALRQNISVDNAVDFLILGDKNRAVNLKTEAKRFITAHAADIINSTGFKSFVITQPRLALETFKLIGIMILPLFDLATLDVSMQGIALVSVGLFFTYLVLIYLVKSRLSCRKLNKTTLGKKYS